MVAKHIKCSMPLYILYQGDPMFGVRVPYKVGIFQKRSNMCNISYCLEMIMEVYLENLRDLFAL